MPAEIKPGISLFVFCDLWGFVTRIVSLGFLWIILPSSSVIESPVVATILTFLSLPIKPKNTLPLASVVVTSPDPVFPTSVNTELSAANTWKLNKANQYYLIYFLINWKSN